MSAPVPPGRWPLVVTCEHATARLPDDLQTLFAAGEGALGGPPRAVLQSHRGFDAGAQEVAVALGRYCHVTPLLGEVSRLVVDLNRSLRHPKLFSPVTRALDPGARRHLVARFWQPHRDRVCGAVAAAVARGGRCCHLALHSFTPQWQGQPRAVDIGLLYDPARPLERQLAQSLARALGAALPGARIRKNQPYQGVSDGLPTALRRRWDGPFYAGIEIEVSQALVHNAQAWPTTLAAIVSACASGLDNLKLVHDSF